MEDAPQTDHDDRPAPPAGAAADEAPVADPPSRSSAGTDWLDDPRLRSLDPRHVTVERIAGWIFCAVVAPLLVLGAGSVVLATWPPDGGTVLLVVGLLALLAGLLWSAQVWPAISYRWYRYLASEEGLEIYRGVWWRSIINVPRSRIQHTDVRQGPLQRRYGVSKLVVHTAGTQHAAVELEGLSREQALALRDLLTARGDDDDAT
jgi:membrane protein YdbS with pleckstrin-like domain